MKKSLLFVINSMGCGGAEKSLLSLLSLLDYDSCDVTLLMFRRGGMFEELLPPQVKIHNELDYTIFCETSLASRLCSLDLRSLSARIRTSLFLRKNAAAGRPLHDAQAYWKYSSAAFDPLPEHYDAAIAWGQGTPTHFVAEKVSADKRLAWVNVNYEAAGHNADFDKPYYGKYDKIVCVSPELNSIFNCVFPEYDDKTLTIFDINNPKTILDMSRRACSLPDENGLTLVTVGRLVSQKGYDIAAKAALILKQRGLHFHWYIVGGGNAAPIEKDISEYGIGDCFTLLGTKSNPYSYMKKADIYVQTSKSEGYCLTLAEARMLNIPCVTTRFDVVYAQMIDGENGLVVDMTPEAVAGGIIRLASDKELYRHIKLYQEHEKKGNTEEIAKFYELIK